MLARRKLVKDNRAIAITAGNPGETAKFLPVLPLHEERVAHE
jgi:hypothetical protein